MKNNKDLTFKEVIKNQNQTQKHIKEYKKIIQSN